MAFRLGKMEPSMMVNGSTEKQVVRENFFTQMETSTRESFLKIRLTDREHIIIKMVQGMSDNGRMT